MALYALHVVAASASSSDPTSASDRNPRALAVSSPDGAPLFLQVLLTVTFLVSGELFSIRGWLCRLQLVTVVVVLLLLLLLSKVESASLNTGEVTSGHW